MALPPFNLPHIQENASGWGPSNTGNDGSLDKYQSPVFQLFNKCDRIGRIVDWLGVDRYYKKSETRDRYNERIYGSSATAGSQFDYVHDAEESNFQLVDSFKPQRPPQRNYRRTIQFKKLVQKDQERRDQAKYGQMGNKANRSINKERMRAYKQWQRRGGGNRANVGRMGGKRFGDRQGGKARAPSIQVRPEWQILEELDFQRLSKLSLPGIESGKDVKGEEYGTLNYYDKNTDKVSVKGPIRLQRISGTFYTVTTTEDPVIQKLAQTDAGNVFATDIILATLMSATRSVNSWDIIAYRVGNKLFFDKRDTGGFSNPVDALWVGETATDPPPFEGGGINNAKDLATEALYINQNFRRQVLKRNETPFKFENERAPFEDENPDARAECAYKYRTWSLGKMSDGTPINLVARTEIDGVTQGPNPETNNFLTIKAFNEWDSMQSGGHDWRKSLDTQKGAILATELKNNSCKLAKWTLQALLAGSDFIKFGYVSRVNVRNSAQHEILGTQQHRPTEFAQNISLNLDNAWGILRVIIELFMKRPPGKYLLLKDPSQQVVRVYSLPEGTFDSSAEESSESSEAEEDAE